VVVALVLRGGSNGSRASNGSNGTSNSSREPLYHSDVSSIATTVTNMDLGDKIEALFSLPDIAAGGMYVCYVSQLLRVFC